MGGPESVCEASRSEEHRSALLRIVRQKKSKSLGKSIPEGVRVVYAGSKVNFLKKHEDRELYFFHTNDSRLGKREKLVKRREKERGRAVSFQQPEPRILGKAKESWTELTI